jgi:predicted metalloprotease with PDZ domain
MVLFNCNKNSHCLDTLVLGTWIENKLIHKHVSSADFSFADINMTPKLASLLHHFFDMQIQNNNQAMVCERLESLGVFIADMEEAPSALFIALHDCFPLTKNLLGKIYMCAIKNSFSDKLCSV